MTPQSTQTDESRAAIAFRAIVGVMVITAMLGGVAPFTATETASAQTGDPGLTLDETHTFPAGVNDIHVEGDRIYYALGATSNTTTGTLGVYNTTTGTYTPFVTDGDATTAFEYDADLRRVFYTQDTAAEIRVYDVGSGSDTQLTPVSSVPIEGTPDPDRLEHGSESVFLNLDETVYAFDADTGSQQWTSSMWAAGAVSVEMTSAGLGVANKDSDQYGVGFLDPDTGTQSQRLATPQALEGWAPDGGGTVAYNYHSGEGTSLVTDNGIYDIPSDTTTVAAEAPYDTPPTGWIEVETRNGYMWATGPETHDIYMFDNSDLSQVDVDTHTKSWADVLRFQTGSLYATNGSNVDVYQTNVAESHELSGTVTDENGTAIANADVVVEEGGTEVTNTTTDASGAYSVSVTAGTYDVTASAAGYTAQTETVTIDGDTTQDFSLQEIGEETELNLHLDRWMPHNSSQPYVVTFTNETGQRSNVTTQATVTSDNASVVTVDSANYELDSTSNESVAARANITANYTSNGVEYTATDYVAVANVSTSNLKVLPPAQRLQGTVTDDTIYVIIIAAMLSVAATRFSSAFGGLSMGTMTMVVGYLGGYVGEGIAMLSLFTALFIGLNLAANIDYTVRR